MKPAAILISLLLLAACGKSGDQSGSAEPSKKQAASSGVTLSAEQIEGLGIATVPASPAQYSAEAGGYGTVVALDTIAQANSDLLAAQAVALQSRSEADRDTYLYKVQNGAISRQTMEAAAAKADSDSAQLALARRKAQAAFGLNPPWEAKAERTAIMDRLATGALVLVRVTFPIGTFAGGLPQTLSVIRLGGGQAWTSNRLWRAPADPAFPGWGIFALVAGSDLTQNDHVTAGVPSGQVQPGVTVPAAAVVYAEGESWVYIRRKNDNFQRARVGAGPTLDGGIFLPRSAGIAPGDAIVTTGAGLLLARELNPSTESQD
jgi:hypothetical protein